MGLLAAMRPSKVMRTHNLRSDLQTLGSDLWWCWQPECRALFRDLDPHRWEDCGHDPRAQLAALTDDELSRIAWERDLYARAELQVAARQRYLKKGPWGRAGVLQARPVAYFSMEYGLHESVRIYSGGLGVLAGDHLKSASDLGVPLVAVGLRYRQGYFVQELDGSGWQQESYPEVPPEALPLRRAVDARGQIVRVTVETRNGPIHAAVWELAVGRVRLLLLDSDVSENSDDLRALTARLYGGDEGMRIRQELLLGVGGARALRALGVRPSVVHLNEGHSAFAALEMVRQHMEDEGVGAADAVDEIASRVVFTTHTPVPAGHDRFEHATMLEALGPLAEEIGLDDATLLSLGQDGDDPRFCMTVLAMKLAQRVNGVSQLHGHVTRRMWAHLHPGVPKYRVPIGHVTNGVHVGTWLAAAMRGLYDRYFVDGWYERQWEPESWAGIERVEDSELWAAHRQGKAALIDMVRRRAVADARRRGEPEETVDALSRSLSEPALLVGFARRFATYKRASLVLSDLDRLDALVNDPARPVHFVFSGKAHPRDEPGKQLIQSIFRVTREPRFLGKVVLLENYDMAIGRQMVQGVDLWLNNPRRPQEASGTSGQKVAINAGLNCSVLDGWWAEAWDGDNGFAIGHGGAHVDHGIQDRRDAEAVHAALTEQVVPLFFDRDDLDLPRDWIRRMKRAVSTCGWRFNSDRMVRDYARRCYLPAAGAKLVDTRASDR